MADPGSVTGLLLAWGKGDEAAFQRLVPLVERELHRIAKRCMAGERAGHSLQATALVNEAYLRLIDVQHVNWQDRAHAIREFFSTRATQESVQANPRTDHQPTKRTVGVTMPYPAHHYLPLSD